MSISLLSPSGRPMVELGGQTSWRQHVKGDIVVSYQWLDRPDIDPEGPHPCMVLFPASRRMDGGAYVIPQRNAFAFANADGSPSAHLMGTAFKAAHTLGFFPDQSTVFRIIDAIVEGMRDLVDMPSSQPGELNLKKLIQGIEATAKVNGKTIAEDLI